MKYAILPQALTPAELIGGNGLVEMGTFVAILAGTLVAGVLVALDGGTAWVSALIVIIGVLGFFVSLAIPKAPAAAASIAFDWNPLRETWANLKFAKQNRAVFLSLLGISWFWFYGLLFLSQFPIYSKLVVGGNEHVVTLLLALFSVGVAVGSLLCERLSGHKVEIWMLVHSIYRLMTSGVENIPEEGPALLVCNHQSLADALVITAACRRPIRFVMYYTIFNVPGLRFLFRSMKAIPIAGAKEAPEVLDRAYDEMAAALEDGQLVCIFPEGQLTRDGDIGPFRPGVTRILERTPVPVIPMALSGLWRSIFSRNRDKWKVATLFPAVSLTVGPALSPAASTPQSLHAIVSRLAATDSATGIIS